VLSALERQISQGPWERIATQSIRKRGRAFLVKTIEEAIDLANRIAPEHLELAFRQAESFLPQVRHAGAIFLGPRSAETLGDYVAGPNHVLPTMGTARFSEISRTIPLGSTCRCPRVAARASGLGGHKIDARIRTTPGNVRHLHRLGPSGAQPWLRLLGVMAGSFPTVPRRPGRPVWWE
jgi:hypothetical protein